jgi:hypothetical protein
MAAKAALRHRPSITILSATNNASPAQAPADRFPAAKLKKTLVFVQDNEYNLRLLLK